MRIELPDNYNAATTFVDENIRQGRGGKVAIYYQEQKITYQEVFEKVNRTGNALKDLGIEIEDRVLVTPDGAAEVEPGVVVHVSPGTFHATESDGPEPLELVSVEELDELLADGAELIDVREKDERDTGYIAGSRNIPYRLLALGETDLPRDRPIVTICETGPRAAIAASILAAHGFDARAVADGGIYSWQAAGKPTVEFRRCGS